MIDQQQLADAADENLAAHAELTCRVRPRSRIERSAELVLVDSGLPCDTFNLICRARLQSGSASSGVQHALAFFRETGHPFSWWLGPGSSPPELPSVLETAGLVRAETELAMGLDLAGLSSQPETPAALRVVRVRHPAELSTFARLSAANWNPPDQNVIRFYQEGADAFLDPGARQWLYLGLLDDSPVATAELTLGGGVAGLYNIATLPEYRGRGIGSIMTWTPLSEARQAGIGMAILQASEMGQGLYARLGFTPFGTITEYKPA